MNNWDDSPTGCAQSLKVFLSSGQEVESATFIVFALSRCANSMSLKPLHQILNHLEVPFDNSESLNQLCRCLCLYVSHLQKTSSAPGTDLSWKELFADMVHTREHWPQVISPSAKNKIRDNFLKMTSYTTLKPAVCASCGESCLESSLQLVSVSSINVDLLRCLVL